VRYTGVYGNITIFVTSGKTKGTVHEDKDMSRHASRKQLAEYVSETNVVFT
jgi:hypothetical protein